MYRIEKKKEKEPVLCNIEYWRRYYIQYLPVLLPFPPNTDDKSNSRSWTHIPCLSVSGSRKKYLNWFFTYDILYISVIGKFQKMRAKNWEVWSAELVTRCLIRVPLEPRTGGILWVNYPLFSFPIVFCNKTTHTHYLFIIHLKRQSFEIDIFSTHIK